MFSKKPAPTTRPLVSSPAKMASSTFSVLGADTSIKGDISASVDLHKLVVTVGVWFVYLVIGLLRWRAKLVATRFAWTCLLMFILALLSLGPVNSSRHHEVVLTPEENR